jgi:hypothetical protein
VITPADLGALAVADLEQQRGLVRRAFDMVARRQGETAAGVRPSPSWRPTPRVRPCLGCGRPRISTSASDRLHPKCRPAGEQNDGEAAVLVLP